MSIDDVATNNQLATYMANLKYCSNAIVSSWTIVWVGEDHEYVIIEYSELVKFIKDEVCKAYLEFSLDTKNINSDIEIDRYVKLVEFCIF